MARRVLTYELCKQIASTCKTITELHAKDISVCTKCYQMGWDKELFPNTKNTSKGRDLSYDYCKEIASTCKCPAELKNLDPSVYDKCLKMGLLDEFYPNRKHPWKNRKLTKELCFEIAKGFHSLIEMRTADSAAARKAVENGWVKDYTWFFTTKELLSRPNLKRRKYTREVFDSIASKYMEYPRKFRKECKSMIVCLKQRGVYDEWIKDYPMLKVMDDGKKTYTVYAILYKDIKSVYVGLTNQDPKQRYAGHKRIHKNGRMGTPLKEALSRGIELPPMTILRSCLTRTEAQELEDYYIKLYEYSGWVTFNKGATGVGKGSIGYNGPIFTKERCYEAAKQCKTYKEFKKRFPSECSCATNKSWTADYPWLYKDRKRRTKFTREHIELMARECRDICEFWDKYWNLYKSAQVKGFLNELHLKQPTFKDNYKHPLFRWNESTVSELVDSIKTVEELRTVYSGAYMYILNNNLHHLMDKLESTNRPRKIAKMDMDGNILEVFNTCASAIESVAPGKNSTGLYACLTGNGKTAYGFKWAYFDEVNNVPKKSKAA